MQERVKFQSLIGRLRTNVRVISHKANTIKQKATPDELRKVADWLEKEIGSD